MTNRDWQTERRLQAVRLYQKGWQQKTIAEALGVTKGAISQWIKKVQDVPQEQWSEVLRVKVSSGRPPLLTPEEKKQIATLVEEGAEACGFTGDVWTVKRVKAMASRELGVKAGATTIRNALIEEGFSVQKPQVEAKQKRQAQVNGFRGGWANLEKGQSEREPPSCS
ncbi:helix-turn-helix domain-containing protein [Armatimonas rosea]|uniref:Transposase n=1 Tax=Armatimonas rosea TaxID=685828 RepID=A0A7W9WAV7_ARMRO|nr:helix-turn-helix domain-containing protein [Armatimonas rosea]MBB6054017.1 transposase [Armatimonas rosea]